MLRNNKQEGDKPHLGTSGNNVATLHKRCLCRCLCSVVTLLPHYTIAVADLQNTVRDLTTTIHQMVSKLSQNHEPPLFTEPQSASSYISLTKGSKSSTCTSGTTKVSTGTGAINSTLGTPILGPHHSYADAAQKHSYSTNATTKSTYTQSLKAAPASYPDLNSWTLIGSKRQARQSTANEANPSRVRGAEKIKRAVVLLATPRGDP